jgi:hypothetical protein
MAAGVGHTRDITWWRPAREAEQLKPNAEDIANAMLREASGQLLRLPDPSELGLFEQ